MKHKLFAFDLDGTLLQSDKRLSSANLQALHEMRDAGAVIVFASGRLSSSVEKYVPDTLDDVALLTQNGAAVSMGRVHGSRRVSHIPLANHYGDFLIDYPSNGAFAVNYYVDDKLYAVQTSETRQWIDLYFSQTATKYNFVDSLSVFRGRSPSKVLFVGSPAVIDEQERLFRARWGDDVYICRTWEHYLEFMDPRVNKANGLEAVATAYGIGLSETVAFGDAENDIPMLRKAGLGIAMKNASPAVKRAARRVSDWTNDEDGVAREWEIIRNWR